MSASVHPLSSPEPPVRAAGSGSAPDATRSVLFRVGSPASGDADHLVLTGSLGRRRSVRLALAGELCAYSAPLLATYLAEHVADVDVVLSTSALSFVDSTGLETCIGLGAAWRRRGRSLLLADPSEAVCRVVRILGLDEVLFGAPPADSTRGPAGGFELEVRNADRGQSIEVTVAGTVEGPTLDSLARRLELLATKRQPATLRLDLTSASVDPIAIDTVVEVARSLEAIGSRLVVVGGGPVLEAAVPSDLLGGPLSFASP